MDHIWKVTGFIKTKYGFYSRLELLAKYGVNVEHKFQNTMLTDSPYNDHA